MCPMVTPGRNGRDGEGARAWGPSPAPTTRIPSGLGHPEVKPGSHFLRRARRGSSTAPRKRRSVEHGTFENGRCQEGFHVAGGERGLDFSPGFARLECAFSPARMGEEPMEMDISLLGPSEGFLIRGQNGPTRLWPTLPRPSSSEHHDRSRRDSWKRFCT